MYNKIVVEPVWVAYGVFFLVIICLLACLINEFSGIRQELKEIKELLMMDPDFFRLSRLWRDIYRH